jgi:hypothetical protein
MNFELAAGVVRLGRGQTLKVRDGAGSTICAREGTLWITEENMSEDVVLAPGMCYRLARPGLALVQAFDDASISLD